MTDAEYIELLRRSKSNDLGDMLTDEEALRLGEERDQRTPVAKPGDPGVSSVDLTEDKPLAPAPQTGKPTTQAFGMLSDMLPGATPGALPPGVEPLSALPPGVEPLPADRPSDKDDAIKFIHDLVATPNEGVPVPFDPVQYRRKNPVLAEMLVTRPDLAPALVADEKRLSIIEQILRPFTGTFSIGEATAAEWKIGKLQVELATLAHRQREMGGVLSPEDEAKAQAVEQEIASIRSPQMGLLAGMIPAMAGQLPRYIQSAGEMAAFTGAGVAVGAGVGLAFGGVGALPGAATGLSYGLMAGVFRTTQREEGDLFYRQALREGVPPVLAEFGAKIVGVANGTLEAAPMEAILRIVPGAKAIMNGPTKDIVRAAFHNPRTRSALLRAAVRAQEGMFFEGLTEGLQEIVSTYELAANKEGKIVSGAGASAVAEDLSQGSDSQILTAALKGYQAAGGMTIVSPGVWAETGTELREAKKAKVRADTIKAMGQEIQKSEVFNKLPNDAKALVEKMQEKYGQIEEMSVPAGRLTRLLAANDVEVSSLPAGIVEQLKNAGETDEIAIKLPDLAAHVAVLKGFENLTPDLRVGDGMTAREALALEAEVKATQAAMKEQSPEDVARSQGQEQKLQMIKEGKLTEVTIDGKPEIVKIDPATARANEPASDARPATDTSPGIHGAKEEGPAESKQYVVRPLDRGDMTEAAYKKYLKKFVPAMEAARVIADRESAREWQRAVDADGKVARAVFEEKARNDKAINAWSEILTGKRLDGEKSKKSMNGRLDLDWIRENVDDAMIPLIQRAAVSGGIDPVRAAKYYGYKSAGEMLTDLANKQVKVVEKDGVLTVSAEPWIRKQVNDFLSEKYPGYNGKRAWAKENVDRALHTDSVGNAIWAGAVAMGHKRATESARAVIKEAAQRDVDASPVWSMSLARTARNEARAAKEAAEAWRARDIDGAYEATRRQMYHHYVWLAINDKIQAVADFKHFADKFDRKNLRKKIIEGGEHFMYAIDALLQWAGMREAPPPWSIEQIGNRLTEYNEALGATFLDAIHSIPTDDKGERGNWQNMTGGQFDQFKTLITALRTLGEEKGAIELGRKKMLFKDGVIQLSEHIFSNRVPPEITASYAKKYGFAGLRAAMRGWDWSLRKIEFLCRILDGGQTAGLTHQMIFQPFVDAEVQEYLMSKPILKELQAKFNRLSTIEKFQYDRMVEFLPTTENGQAVMFKLRRRDVLAVALNLRNEGNMQRLLSSMGWAKEDVVKRLGMILTAKDVEIINEMGAMAERFWPQVKDLYRKIFGKEPQVVMGKDVTIQLADGTSATIQGGYYPIIKDFSKIGRPELDSNALFDTVGFDPVAVNDNFTKDRAQKNADPLLLDIDALPRHLVKVIHYVTHYEAVTNVDRLTQAPEVKSAIIDGLGKDAYDQIRPWLRDIARQSSQGDGVMTHAEKFLRHIRIGASIVLLFFKTSTAVKQIIGLTTTLKEIGWKYTAIGGARFVKDVSAWITSGFKADSPFTVIRSQDPTFTLLRENIDRDIKDMYRGSTSGMHMTAAFRHGVTTMGMALFQLFQGSVNAITWHGALAKATVEGHARPMDFASSVVRMTQSSGGLKDLAAFQRGKEWQKMFTVMYSWYSVLYNQFGEDLTGQPIDKTRAQKIGTAAAHFFYLAVLPSFLSVAMKGHLSDDDDPVDKLSEVALETALFSANAAPMADQLAKAFLEGRDARVAPWLDMLVKGAGAMHHAVSGDDVTDADVRNAWNAAGVAFHAPTGAALNAWNYIEALLDGTMDDPVEDLLFRTPREAR